MNYVIADGQPAMVMLIERLLRNAREQGSDEIHAVHSCERLWEVLIRLESSVSIAILDPSILGANRIALMRALRFRCPLARFIAYAGDESPFQAAQLIDEGVRRYVFKTSPTMFLMHAVRQAREDSEYYDPRIDFDRVKNDPWTALTPKQQEVCLLILKHGSIGRIVENGHRSYDTIWTHWSKAKKTLGIRHEVELARYFHHNGLSYLLDD